MKIPAYPFNFDNTTQKTVYNDPVNSPTYGHLAQVYDDLFPLEEEALSLVLDSLVGMGSRYVLDAGCGTGLLVRALADRGVQAHGFDVDADLLSKARSKEGGLASFGWGDLRSFSLPEGFPIPGLVTCLGNTLPHLLEQADLGLFFRSVRSALSPHGRVLLQTLDYDYLEQEGLFQLPDRRLGDLLFTRTYEVRGSGLWSFRTKLTSPGGQSSAQFDLRPWRRLDLETALKASGFFVEGVWGGFDLAPPGFRLPLVLRARLL